MLKHFYKTVFIALLGVLSFQESFAQIPAKPYAIGDTVCSNSANAVITVFNSVVGDRYFAHKKGDTLVSPINPPVSTGGYVTITIPIKNLKLGKNTIVVSYMHLDVGDILDTVDVVVNQQPRTDQRVVSKPYCPGAAASIIIYGTRPGEIYEPNLSAMAIGAPVKSVTDTVLLNIATNMLPSGLNEIYFRASIEGCAMVQLENKGYIMPMPIGDYFYRVVGDTICSSNPYAELLFTNTSPVVNHQIYINEIAVSEPFKGENNDFIKKIPTSLLTVGANNIEVQAEVESGCGTLLINTTVSVLVYPSIKFDEPILIGDRVTLPAGFATISIIDPIIGVKYRALDSNMQIGDSAIAWGQDTLKLRIPVGAPNGLPVGTHEMTISFIIGGCEAQTITGKTTIVVKPALITSIDDKQITSNFAVYPNPFSSEITITSKLKGQLKMQITDAIGNIVHQESISNTQDLKLNPDLKSGLYFLQMESEGVRETVKLVKQ